MPNYAITSNNYNPADGELLSSNANGFIVQSGLTIEQVEAGINGTFDQEVIANAGIAVNNSKDITLDGGSIKLGLEGGVDYVDLPIVSGAASGPLTANARAGKVTFTGISIAADAVATLTINNTQIVDANTVVAVSMYGATTGSALSLANVVSGVGTLTLTVTNGTGATTSVANITVVFEIKN